MDNNITIQDIMIQTYRIYSKYARVKSVPYAYVDGEPLRPSEIHVIDAIGKNYGDTVTELGHRLGVTKGAVSQIVTALTEKGYVSKSKDKRCFKETVLTLTEKGQQAFFGHEKLHEAVTREYLNDLADDDHIKEYKTALDKMERYVDRIVEFSKPSQK